jgi:hypothetical protein
MQLVWGRGETYTGFWWGNPRERDHLGDPGVSGRIILRLIFSKYDVGVIPPAIQFMDCMFCTLKVFFAKYITVAMCCTCTLRVKVWHTSIKFHKNKKKSCSL